ncbi:MAG: hypothetical protein JWQ78_1836 [Sediminibacterium sp.]|nr:hypothetical protein [Sediminibacterium sp.]
MTGYKKLEAWKKFMVLVKEVYSVVKDFPKEELHGIGSQAKRAAVSIPSNIAEGCGRQYKRDTRKFLYISRGSLYELETVLNIATMVDILAPEKLDTLMPLITENLKIINGLIHYYETESLK